MIAAVSNKFASFIRKYDENAASQEVLVYGISVFLHTLLTILMILAISAATGHLLDAVVAMSSFVILRLFSGGVHLHTSWKCDILSITAIVAVAHADFSYGTYGWLMTAIALVLVTILAPNNPNLTYRLVEKHSGKLKWISMLLVALNFWFQSPVVAIALLLQSLTLTKPFYWIFNLIDRR
jgi:accessory gene regulator B